VTDEKMISEEVQVTMRDKPLKQLNRIAKRPKLDVEFQDLSYSVRDSNAKGGEPDFFSLKSVQNFWGHSRVANVLPTIFIEFLS
jgi:hypothetical protein